MNTTQQVIEGAITLLKEKGWTQGAGARDAKGNRVSETNPEATCYCLVGALSVSARSLPGSTDDTYFNARNRVGDVLWRRGSQIGLTTFNDQEERKVEDVIELLESAKDKEVSNG